jgi:peptidoglycan/LPS O-acetylase OafA/YrhL
LSQLVAEHAPPVGSTVGPVESAQTDPSRGVDRDRAQAEFQARREFGSLDGLRALSIVAVIWHHACQPPFGWAFLGRGAEGVSFFFVISGFLITSLLLRERDRFGSVSLTKFYARRTLRIFPLYFAVLAAFCLLGLVRGVGSDFGTRFFPHLPLYLTYTSNWSPARSAPFGYSWSLACEEQFYFLWPPVLVLLGMRAAPWALVLLLGANRAAHYGLLDSFVPPTHFLTQLLRTLQPAIVLGVLLAAILHSKRGYSILAPILRGRAACLAAFAVVIGMLSLGLDLHSSLALDVAMAIAVGACVVPARHALTPFLTLWPVRRIGVVSYGMYMFHEPLRTVIRRFADLPPTMLFVALALLTWAAAELSYRTFEKPFRRLKARFERHRPAAVVVERLQDRAPVRTAPTDGAWISRNLA